MEEVLLMTLAATRSSWPRFGHPMPSADNKEIGKRIRRLNALCGKEKCVGQVALLTTARDIPSIGLPDEDDNWPDTTSLSFDVGIVTKPVSVSTESPSLLGFGGRVWHVPIRNEQCVQNGGFTAFGIHQKDEWAIAEYSVRFERTELIIGAKDIFAFFERKDMQEWVHDKIMPLWALYRCDPKLLGTRQVKKLAKPLVPLLWVGYHGHPKGEYSNMLSALGEAP